jgi:putative hemin transport protein
MPTSTPSAPDLQSRWTALRAESPDRSARAAARELDVSEAELVAAGCGDDVTRLDGPWRSLLHRLEDLGPVTARTRNDAAVHETTGRYTDVTFTDTHDMGLVLADVVDLRLFMNEWAHGFAVDETDTAPPSLQFFAPDGTAVHKVVLTDDSDHAVYRELVDAYRHDDQSPGQSVTPADDDPPTPNPDVDAEAFLDAWADLEDTHDFFPLLQEYDVSRPQALRLGEGRFTRRVPDGSLRTVLQLAAKQETPIMVFVGSPGCIQIHTGPVHNLEATPPHYKVLDADFRLHLDENRVAQSWVVKKPTSDGPVTSLELMDADGGVIARLFGKREPGQPERTDWRTLLEKLPSQG